MFEIWKGGGQKRRQDGRRGKGVGQPIYNRADDNQKKESGRLKVRVHVVVCAQSCELVGECFLFLIHSSLALMRYSRVCTMEGDQGCPVRKLAVAAAGVADVGKRQKDETREAKRGRGEEGGYAKGFKGG